MARVYDALMFRGATYGDLVKRGLPLVSVNATDIAGGTAFAFTQPSFDLICSDLAAVSGGAGGGGEQRVSGGVLSDGGGELQPGVRADGDGAGPPGRMRVPFRGGGRRRGMRRGFWTRSGRGSCI